MTFLIWLKVQISLENWYLFNCFLEKTSHKEFDVQNNSCCMFSCFHNMWAACLNTSSSSICVYYLLFLLIQLKLCLFSRSGCPFAMPSTWSLRLGKLTANLLHLGWTFIFLTISSILGKQLVGATWGDILFGHATMRRLNSDTIFASF